MRTAGAVHPIALFFSFALGIVGFALGANALHKSGLLKDFVLNNIPSGITASISFKDCLSSGGVLTAGCGLLALASLFTLLRTLLSRRRSVGKGSNTRLSAFIHLFLALWILASLIAFDVIARTRQAKVSASLGGTALSASAIAAQEQILGVTPKYWSHNYIRALAILPWFTFLSALISGFLLLHSHSNDASSRTHGANEGPLVAGGGGAVVAEAAAPEDEKKRDIEEAESPVSPLGPKQDAKH